jgi:SecD/SecF fusion protein
MRTSPLRLLAYLLVVGLGLLFAWPNLLTKEQAARLPGFLPSRQVALGLDLRGGSHLVLEVDSAALVRERLQDVASRTRELLRRADISPSITQTRTTIDVRLANPDQMRRALTILRQAWTGVGPDAGQIDLEKQGPEQIRITLSDAGIRDRVNAAAEQSL